MTASRLSTVLVVIAAAILVASILFFFQTRDPLILMFGIVGAGITALVGAFFRANAQRRACGQCGAANLPHAKFCSQCGKPF